jgi:pilus assembly protein CpaB
MAALVPDGMRAFTVPTPSAASGVAGFILPGNKVDVLLTLEGRRGSVTTTLVQNLEILAVDQRTDAPADNRIDPNHLRSVTLLVTPDQAAKLGLAQNKGALHLALRNHRDDQVAATSPARLAELDDGFREETRARATPEAPKPLVLPPVRVVTIYRGNRPAERLRIGEAPPPPAESVLAAGEPPMDGSQ